MYKKIIFGLFIAAFIGIGVYWFLYFKEVKTPISDGINYIPSDAAIIFESKQSQSTWKKLSQTNIMWEELLSAETFSELNKQGKYMDSLLLSTPSVAQLLNNQALYISAHPTKENNYQFLFVYSLPNLTYQSEIESLIKKINNNTVPTYKNYKSSQMATITSSSGNINLIFHNGTLLISKDQSLLESAISQYSDKKSILSNLHFKEVLNASGKNVDANIYINYKTFSNITSIYTHPELKNEMDWFSNMAEYSGWDVAIKPNSLMLNGFTYVNDSSKNYLSLFRKQKPQNIQVVNVIPSKTALMISYGISSYKLFIDDLYENNYTQKQETDAIYSKYHINFEEVLTTWFDNEMTLVITQPDTVGWNEHSLAYLHSIEIDRAIEDLNSIAENVRMTDTLKQDTLTYHGFFINKLSINNILPKVLGGLFSKIKNNYFTGIDNYVVFANSQQALISAINDFENNKTLGNDKNYKSFAENISAQSNFYLYSAMPKSSEYYKSFLNTQSAGDIQKNKELVRKFEAVAIQFSSGNKLFYSNAFIKYNPSYKKEVETIWETKLDTTISMQPFVLINHNTKAKDILVQDDANKLYLISNTGKIIWTKKLNEKIMSGVTQIDALKNNKLQLLFNTRSSIYLFDRNGNDMKGFPIKLNSDATNNVSVFDYDKNREYRIFIATEDKKINCYTTAGELVNGFKFDKTMDIVVSPIKFIEIDKKDHLFAIDIKGKIYCFNRQGELKIKLKDRMPQGIKDYYIEPGKDYSKTFLIAADTLGKVVKVNLKDEKENIEFSEFENSPHFILCDINNDKMKEFIFLTRKELKVFSQDKSLLFSYSFQTNSIYPPQCFKFNETETKIGVSINESNELFLFNSDGTLYNELPLKGKTLFEITDINNDENLHLVTGSADNSVYLYNLQ